MNGFGKFELGLPVVPVTTTDDKPWTDHCLLRWSCKDNSMSSCFSLSLVFWKQGGGWGFAREFVEKLVIRRTKQLCTLQLYKNINLLLGPLLKCSCLFKSQ